MKTIFNNFSIRHVVIVLLFLTILLSLRWLWSEMFPSIEHPHAIQGVLDLRGWDIEHSSAIDLNGEWELYPSAFISNEDTKKGHAAGTPSLVQVPGDWHSAFSEDAQTSYGYGTYRLRILIDAPLDQPYALWIQDIQSSSAVEINGQKEKEIGHPAAEEPLYFPRNISYTASYTAEKDVREIELLIRVANYEHPYYGGIAKSIRFGSQAAIDYVRWYSIGFQLASFIILMLHCLYTLILYMFNPRQKAFLAFCLLILAGAFTVVSDNDHILQIWLPINYMWMQKIRLFSYMWVSFFILYLTRTFFGKTEGRRLFRAYVVVLVLYSVFALIVPPPLIYYSRKMMIFGVIYLFPVAWIVYLAIKMVIKKQPDSIYLLLAIISIASSVLWGGSGNVYYPIDLIAAIIAFSAYWFKRYFRNAEENAQLNEQLKESDRLKDQFLANTSHELRTPLHGIMNIAQNIITHEQHSIDSKSLEDLQLLVKISSRMSHMVDDLLDVVRLREKRIVLKKEPTALKPIVSGIFSMLGFMTAGKNILLEMNIAETMPRVLVDEKRLVQILFNLVHNALKYTTEGSVCVTAQTENGQAIITVSDTGVGMDEETQARVFLRYEQGVHGKNNGQGIGLGLSICNELVELHGGEMTLHSEPGKGSMFSFSLPLADSESLLDEHMAGYGEAAATLQSLLKETTDTSSSSVVSLPFGEGKANILAIDDDPVNLKVLAGILRAEAYNVKLVTSADEALALLASEQWDLIVSDVMMPVMTGYELTRKIRERFSVSELPVLLLTARSEPADIYAGFKSGANDYVAKPVDPMELKYRIRSLTSMKKSVQERLQMEAAYLQAQIQPHFLFNTLNSIMALSDLDPERMRKLGDAFTEYLRISFHFLNSSKLVTLFHELELVRTYLYIEKERFGNKLTVVWEGESDSALPLPPLTIQPLVENAVKHGALSRSKGGTVYIRIHSKDNSTYIEVKDDGKGMKAEEIRHMLDHPVKKGTSGIGLFNTNRRLTQLYGKGLVITSKEGEGTSVSFVIPVKNTP